MPVLLHGKDTLWKISIIRIKWERSDMILRNVCLYGELTAQAASLVCCESSQPHRAEKEQKKKSQLDLVESADCNKEGQAKSEVVEETPRGWLSSSTTALLWYSLLWIKSAGKLPKSQKHKLHPSAVRLWVLWAIKDWKLFSKSNSWRKWAAVFRSTLSGLHQVFMNIIHRVDRKYFSQIE